jgi:hypothetical protein
MKCRSEGSADGTSLTSCVKIYVPLGKDGASEAPYGFVFELEMRSDGALGLDFLAFGERHPRNALGAMPLPLPLPPPCQIGHLSTSGSGAFPIALRCRRRDSNPRHADYDSAALTS